MDASLLIRRRLKELAWSRKMGSVATFNELTGAGVESAISGSHPEQPVDELNLPPNIRAVHPSRLPLPNHVHRLIALNCSGRRLELSEPLLGVQAPFDGSVIMFQDIVQVLHRGRCRQRRRGVPFFMSAMAEP